MAHTQGEWVHHGSMIFGMGTKEPPVRGGVVCQLSEPHPDNGLVHHDPIDIGSPGWDEAMDNGRLIKAAPALLAELELVRENLAMLVHDQLRLESYDFGSINEVIARARGECRGRG